MNIHNYPASSIPNTETPNQLRPVCIIIPNRRQVERDASADRSTYSNLDPPDQS